MVFIGISILTGTFVQLFILFAIILIHEAGHYAVAQYYKWEIHGIVLWVFGGVMKTDRSTSRPIKQDVFVTIAGPLQHLWIYGLLLLLEYWNVLPASVLHMAYQYNLVLLLFNLLPIYPLDGGKLLLYFLSAHLPYKKAMESTLLYSVTCCVFLLLFQLWHESFTLSAFLLALFVGLENIMEWRNRSYLFMQFLLQRMQTTHITVLDMNENDRLIDAFYLFRRNHTHEIRLMDSRQVISERDCLQQYFVQQRIRDTFQDIWPTGKG